VSVVRWSNSALTTLQQCGEKFRRRYIEREYGPPSPRMLRGTVVHRTASRALLRKLTDRTLPTVEEAKDAAAGEFERAWTSGVVLSDEEQAQGAATVRGEAKDFAVDLSGFHVGTVAPVIEPVAIERKITVKPKDSDIEILGTVDLIDRRPDGEAIRDLKTSEKSPYATAAETSQQLSLYGLIRLAETGALPVRYTLDYLVRTPKKAEKKHVPLETTRDMADMRALVHRINTAVEAVKRGSFVPANPDSWWCSRAYCDYFTDCPYVRRGDSRPTT
jgi:hypothetical protein